VQCDRIQVSHSSTKLQTHARTHARTHTHKHTHITHTHTKRTHTHVQAHTHTCTRPHKHTHAHAGTQKHARTHARTHTQSFPRRLLQNSILCAMTSFPRKSSDTCIAAPFHIILPSIFRTSHEFRTRSSLKPSQVFFCICYQSALYFPCERLNGWARNRMETIFLLRLEKEGKRILYSLLFVTSMQYGHPTTQ
jgi:hypothetical protein